MTKSVRRLEDELHVQLLQRSARGARPTRLGRAFLARARIVQSELRKVEEDLAELQGERGGIAAFGVAPGAGVLLVPDAIQQFRRNHPLTRVRIIEGVTQALLPLVRDETLDFSVGQKPPHKLEAAIRFKPLFRTQLVVAGRRGHPLRAAKSLQELAQAQWLTFLVPGGGGILERAFSAAALGPPKVIVQCESYAAALALLGKSDTLALVVPQLFAEPLAGNHLERIVVAETMPALSYGMFTRAEAPLAPAAAAMAQAVTATARRLARN